MADGDEEQRQSNEKSTPVGGHGLGERNEVGTRLVDFCSTNYMKIANTCFEQPKRRLYIYIYIYYMPGHHWMGNTGTK